MYGIGAVGGMAMGKLLVIKDDNCETIKISIENAEAEYARFIEAKKKAAAQLEHIISEANEKLGDDNAGIFDYQLLMLEDGDFLEQVKNIIQNEKANSEYAVRTVAEKYVEIFKNIDNDYLKERTTDIEDLAKRITFALKGKEMVTLSEIMEDSIVAAEDLTPSQTAGINSSRVKGIILQRGGKSSHSVIIARSMGIPCIVGVQGLLNDVSDGQPAIINGDKGSIILWPSHEQIMNFREYEKTTALEKEGLSRFIGCESRTLDGHEVKVFANITGESEVDAMLSNGGEGIGLFRTEFMYMLRNSPPDEEFQFGIYSRLAKALGDKPLIIRTLDAGGDKGIAYLNIQKEENPFLGYRAIRYCLDNKELFKSQISAILRAGAAGNVRLMVPMISTIEELRQVKSIINEVKAGLIQKKLSFSNNIKLGMMVETPAAAFMADRFAKEADFFSIGTNDLTQYLFAADRMNEKVAYLNSYYNPALLKMVDYVCKCANDNGIEVDICGQAGEITELVPVWIGMGITNLSVSIPAIPKVRKLICETSKTKAREQVQSILSLNTAEEVEKHLKQ